VAPPCFARVGGLPFIDCFLLHSVNEASASPPPPLRSIVSGYPPYVLRSSSILPPFFKCPNFCFGIEDPHRHTCPLIPHFSISSPNRIPGRTHSYVCLIFSQPQPLRHLLGNQPHLRSGLYQANVLPPRRLVPISLLFFALQNGRHMPGPRLSPATTVWDFGLLQSRIRGLPSPIPINASRPLSLWRDFDRNITSRGPRIDLHFFSSLLRNENLITPATSPQKCPPSFPIRTRPLFFFRLVEFLPPLHPAPEAVQNKVSEKSFLFPCLTRAVKNFVRGLRTSLLFLVPRPALKRVILRHYVVSLRFQLSN